MSQKLNSTVTVNLAALQNNLEVLRQKADAGTGIMAVVKGDAYGHGAVPVAKFLQPHVTSFAVNDINEAVELRENGITAPVLVFSVPEKQFAALYRKHNVTATVSSSSHFDLLPPGTAYHLNFDTGMGRLGFLPEEAGETADIVERNNHLVCTGIYSHLATSHVSASDKVDRQYEIFREIRRSFPARLPAHICNTGGTVFYDLDPFQAVRLGIGLYGYEPGTEKIEGLQPVLEWSTHLIEVKEKKEGSSVSYGASWQLPADGYVGVIPVGYDDGLRRNLSGQLRVGIGSGVYEVAGTITMNYSMVYLGDDRHPEGTEVVLLDGKELTAREWAAKLETIPYEILTGISSKIPRTYSED